VLTDLREQSLYTGTFANNLRDGMGTLNCSTGETYFGWFKEDNMHGNGTVTYPAPTKKTSSDIVRGDKFRGSCSRRPKLIG
jgi:hypothetical protein